MSVESEIREDLIEFLLMNVPFNWVDSEFTYYFEWLFAKSTTSNFCFNFVVFVDNVLMDLRKISVLYRNEMIYYQCKSKFVLCIPCENSKFNYNFNRFMDVIQHSISLNIWYFEEFGPDLYVDLLGCFVTTTVSNASVDGIYHLIEFVTDCTNRDHKIGLVLQRCLKRMHSIVNDVYTTDQVSILEKKSHFVSRVMSFVRYVLSHEFEQCMLR